MGSIGFSKESRALHTLRWIFLYHSLTDDQKDELYATIPEVRIPDYASDPCFILSKDHRMYIRYYNIALTLKERLSSKFLRLVWKSLGTTLELKVVIKEKHLRDTDSVTTNRRLQIFRGMKDYNARTATCQKTIVIRMGEINRCYSEAIEWRNDTLRLLGIPLNSVTPTLFMSPDVLNNGDLPYNVEFSDVMTHIFGRDKDNVLLAESSSKQSINTSKIIKYGHLLKCPKISHAISEKSRKKSAGWDMDKIKQVLHTEFQHSDVNKKFKKTYHDLHTTKTDVVIVGAGVAGLVAANYLSSCGAELVVLEGRDRIGGRACTTKFPEKHLESESIPAVDVDLGANYLHCCNILDTNKSTSGDEPLRDSRSRRKYFRSLLGLCEELRPNVADVAGGANWESTVYTRWGDLHGKRIHMTTVLKANMIAEKIRMRAARKVHNMKKYMRSLPGNANTVNEFKDVWYVREGIYRKIFNVPSGENTKSHAEAYVYSLSHSSPVLTQSCVKYGHDDSSTSMYNSDNSQEWFQKDITTFDGSKDNYKKLPNLNAVHSPSYTRCNVRKHSRDKFATMENGCTSDKTTAKRLIVEHPYKYGPPPPGCSLPTDAKHLSNRGRSGKNPGPYLTMEKMLKNSPLGVPRHINTNKSCDSKAYLFDEEGNRKSLWDIYIESLTEVFQENKLSYQNVDEVVWNMIFVILQSRIGYNSDLRETCISMCRLPNIDEEFDESTYYLSNENSKFNLDYVTCNYEQQTSVNTGKFRCENDSDKLVIDGWDWLLNSISNGIESSIYLNSKVSDMEVLSENTDYPVVVQVQSSSDPLAAKKVVVAKYAIVAVPSSMISPFPYSREYPNQIVFKPPLHPLKCEALTRYKMGHHNKVILRFKKKDIFWSTGTPQLNTLDPRFQFLNLDMYGKEGCLLAHCFPPYSVSWANIDSDEEIVRQCLEVLRMSFGVDMESMPYPIDAMVTRWYKDPFAMGSYSYPGVNASDDDIIYLKSPHPLGFPRILFAGEYLSSSYYQCVDGAYDTGMRAAEDVAHLGLKKAYPFPITSDTPSLDGMFDPSSKERYLGMTIPLPGQDLLGFYLTDGSDEAITDDDKGNEAQKLGRLHNEELSALEALKHLMGSTSESLVSYYKKLLDVINALKELQSKNHWNSVLRAALNIAKAIKEVATSLQGDTEVTDFDMSSPTVSTNILKTFLENEGHRHDFVCHACLAGGELLMCDSINCSRVWHAECLPLECAAEFQDTCSPWICPSCQGFAVRRGHTEVPTAVSLYWKRRCCWWSVKTLMTHCRKINDRITLLREKSSRS